MTQRTLLKMCISKKSYTNLDEANLAGLKQIKQYSTADTLYMYLCRNCNKWHLTKKETKYKVI